MNRVLALILFIVCGTEIFSQEAPLQTVSKVDLNKYLGLWYEIASFPTRFQKGCSCSTAEYKVQPDKTIKVLNKCFKEGKLSKVEGKAFIVPNSGNSKLKVQFFWPFKADYWIIELDENYRWAVVGNESRKYLWILSRSKEMPIEVYKSICEKIAKKGFSVEKLQRTIQDCK